MRGWRETEIQKGIRKKSLGAVWTHGEGLEARWKGLRALELAWGSGWDINNTVALALYGPCAIQIIT